MNNRVKYPLLILAISWLVGLLIGTILFKFELLLSISLAIGILLFVYNIDNIPCNT